MKKRHRQNRARTGYAFTEEGRMALLVSAFFDGLDGIQDQNEKGAAKLQELYEQAPPGTLAGVAGAMYRNGKAIDKDTPPHLKGEARRAYAWGLLETMIDADEQTMQTIRAIAQLPPDKRQRH